MTRTPLEPWIAARIGYRPETGEAPAAVLERYQLRRLRATVDYVREKSPFYRRLLAGVRGNDLRSVADVARLPFTTAADLQQHELELLCVSRAEIERVVTLQSSGTTAAKKRLHFSAADLEETVDFYHHGMATLVRPGERVLILMPGELPGSVGDLLVRALPRFGATGIVHGLVSDPAATLARIVAEKIDALVGLPIQILALARHPQAGRVRGQLQSVLTSADHLPEAVREAVARAWGVPIFDHYGMTEMALGGGVECAALAGYHLREADFFWEVVHPQSGRPLPPGEAGEVVFTTLGRQAMPLVRYRTGDQARLLVEPCPCGSWLRRLEKIERRYAGDLVLAGGGRLNIAALDGVLLPLPFLLNYHPLLVSGTRGERLELRLQLQGAEVAVAAAAVRRRLLEVPVIAAALAAGTLELGAIAPGPMPIASGSVKRCLEDQRKESLCLSNGR